MRARTKWIAATSTTLIVLGATGAGIAAAANSRDSDTPITGSALGRATSVALAATGGGRVTGTEVNDEESKYQVEVTLDNGQQVDVNLDAHFAVVKTKTDHEAANDKNG